MPDARFTTDHLWVRLQDGIATVGVTGFASDALGTVARVELPQPGRRVLAGEACATVETVKAASDAHAPMSGHILDANAALLDDPALVNRGPEGTGWLHRLAPDDLPGIYTVMDQAAYNALVDAL
jgi:glycine cleavage system H protein